MRGLLSTISAQSHHPVVHQRISNQRCIACRRPGRQFVAVVSAKPCGNVSQTLLAVTKLNELGVKISIKRFSGLTHNREEPPLVLIKRQPIKVVRAEHEPGVVIDLMPVAALVFDADLILGDERLEGLDCTEL